MKIKKSSLWMYTSIVLAVLFILSLIVNGVHCSNNSLNSISSEEAGQEVKDFFKEYQNKDINIEGVKEISGLFMVNVELNGQRGNVFLTKDGKFIGSMTDLSLLKEQIENAKEEQKPKEVPKTDRPKIELFIMSYCPFGIQMEKALLPVIELLGDKADISVKFVDYAMHGKKELDENLRQYCIQKEQNDKFLDYAYCFLEKGEGSEEECLNKAKIDKEKLNKCIEKTDKEFNVSGMYNDKSTWQGGRFPQFNIHKELNEKYGVRGSPTLIINGVEVSISRSPEAIKEAVCNAFSEKPEECNKELSSTVESYGFGFNKEEGGNSGTC